MVTDREGVAWMKQRLIDANEAENALYGFTRYTGIDEAPYEHAEAVINKLPTVEAERKKGKWVNGTCNQCGSHAPYWPMASTYYESNFCPHCGADMRGEEDEID